jgi:hypothetical protein
VFAAAFGAALWRFGPFMPPVLFGDDLANVLAFEDGKFASSLGQALRDGYAEKFRPAFATACWIVFGSLGQRVEGYMTVNVALHAAAATLLFATARRLGASGVAALAVALAFATSRLALYQVTQVTGLVESLSLLGCLAMLYAAIRAAAPGASAAWPWVAVAAAFVTVHTHERYVVVLPWLAAVGLAWARWAGWTRRRVVAWAAACAGVAAFNVVAKRALGLPFLVGTGGTHIKADLPSMWRHLTEAVLSSLGVNHGPDYLAGASVLAIRSTTAWFLSQLMIAATIGAIVWGVRASRGSCDRERTPLRSPWLPLALAALAALLLVPPISTIRLEQRWILAPFTLVLLVLAWASAAAGPRRLPASLPALVFAVAVIVLDTRLARYYRNIFFVGLGQRAAVVKREVVDRPWPPGTIAVIMRPDICGWGLSEGSFFRVYRREATSIRCVYSSDPGLASKIEDATTVLAYDDLADPEHVRDVTASVRTAAASR